MVARVLNEASEFEQRKDQPLKFRPTGWGFIPYVELRFEPKTVRTLVVGPNALFQKES